MKVHEPECTYTPGRDGFAGTGIQFQRAYIPPQPCICPPLRAAYQRGDAAGYQRGREDAAQAVLEEPTIIMRDERHQNGDWWMRQNGAIAAARGESAE